MKKKRRVSIDEPINDEIKGETYHFLFLRNLSNIWISKFWAIKKANPEPIAILIEIMSEKLVETNSVMVIPIEKPSTTTFLAKDFPNALFVISVIRNVTG